MRKRGAGQMFGGEEVMFTLCTHDKCACADPVDKKTHCSIDLEK